MSFFISLGALSRKVSENMSLLQSEKNTEKIKQISFFRECFWDTFLLKTDKKDDPKPSLKQEHALLHSGSPRPPKKGFRQVPVVSATQ